MNVAPYGMEFNKPVGRLEEAIKVIRLLWGADGPVDFDGKFFQLQDAVLGLDRLRGRSAADLAGRPRPAHARHRRPPGRRLAADEHLAGRSTRDKLGRIRRPPRGAGRDPDAITPSMLAYVMCAPDEETLDRMCESPLARLLFAAVDLPPETYERHGSTSPFEGGTGFHSFLPSTVSRAEALRIATTSPRDRARPHAVRHAGADRRPDPRLPAGGPARRGPVEHHAVRRPGHVGLLLPRPARAAQAAGPRPRGLLRRRAALRVRARRTTTARCRSRPGPACGAGRGPR